MNILSSNIITHSFLIRQISILIIILCSVIFLNAYAQQPVLKFTNINTEHGLSENTVLDIVQDPYGFMWFATENGLTKYDGVNYTVFRDDDHDSISLTNDLQSLCIKGDELFITSIYPTIVSALNLKTEQFRILLSHEEIDDIERAYFLDNDNYMLLFTNKGKYIYNEQSGQFEVYDGLNSVLEEIGIPNSPECEMHAESPPQAERYFLDDNDELVGFKPECGLFEIRLQDLSHKCLFSCKELHDLYNFETQEENYEAFLYRDSEKRIWFNFGHNQLGFFHHISGTFHSMFPEVLIKDIFEDNDNNLWFASESGILFYDSDADLMYHFAHQPTEKHSLSNNYISSILMSDNEILWVGHDGGGVDHARYYSIKHFHLLNSRSESSLISDRITGISESVNRDVWISTDLGVNKWDLKREVITSYLEDVFINNIFCDSRGNVWCINRDREILLKRPADAAFEKINFRRSNIDNIVPAGTSMLFFEDSKNRLWLIGHGLFLVDYEALRLIKNEASSEIEFASSVREDKKGNFWITGNTGKLIVINPDLEASHFYSSNINDSYSLNSNILWDLYIDNKEILWVATNRGVNKTNISSYTIGDDLRFESYSLNDGLNDEIVFRIIGDEKGDLWFATNNGLSRMLRDLEESDSGDVAGSKFINYFIVDGIASNSIGCYTDNHITFPCGTRLSSGEIMLGSSNGITSFNPKTFPGRPLPTTVLFTDLKIFNRSVPIGAHNNRNILSQSISVTGNIELSYKDRVFSLDFISLDYGDPRKNQYEYMLEGFDDDWIFLDNNRVVTFTNIPGGDYTLKIRPVNITGDLNIHEASLGIRIKPPFWQTWWLRILGIAFFIGSFFLFYYLRTYQMYQQKLKLAAQVKQRTREIEEKNMQLEGQARQLNEANILLEEKKVALEDQSEELRVINARLLKQKSELEELNKKVQMANQAKLKFFTNISHELRTPLTLIKGPIDNILSNAKLSKYVKDQLDMMNRNTSRLLKLINQLLDFRKLETEHMKLAVAEGNIILLLEEIYMLFSNHAKQKQIEYEFNSKVDELTMWYDGDKIEKIISNLLSNAFKYTSEGGKISINLSLVNDQLSHQSKFEIMVSDTGIGIAKNKVNHIFERYFSAYDFNNLDVTSAGIGLAVTKDLVELHKGSIIVESKVTSEEDPRSGTQFTISLPVGKEYFSENERLAEDRAVEIPSSHPEDILLDLDSSNIKKIDPAPELAEYDRRPEALIVEDNADMRDFIKGVLIGNYRIQTSNNGKTALEIIESNSISMIISDVMMPEMDGIDLCRHVKENLNTSHIPVILLTAKTDIESQISGLKSGADDYITKPFNSQILIEKINNLILSRERLWERFNKQVVFDPGELTPNSLDIKLLNKVKEVVEIHLSNPDLDVSLFAREVGMSKSILYEKLKSLTGKTINEFISSIRLKKAAELILQGELNLSEISMEVGYLDPNYFSKSFKKHFGVVPSKFTGKSAEASHKHIPV